MATLTHAEREHENENCEEFAGKIRLKFYG